MACGPLAFACLPPSLFPLCPYFLLKFSPPLRLHLQTLEMPADVLAVSFRPDGRQLCCACLNGTLQLWGTDGGDNQGIIEGRRDIAGTCVSPTALLQSLKPAVRVYKLEKAQAHILNNRPPLLWHQVYSPWLNAMS